MSRVATFVGIVFLVLGLLAVGPDSQGGDRPGSGCGGGHPGLGSSGGGGGSGCGHLGLGGGEGHAGQCDSPQFRDPVSGKCVDCPAGQYPSGKSTCALCPDGQYRQQGQRKCAPCPLMTKPSPDHSKCVVKWP